jgi:hypothetical protein
MTHFKVSIDHFPYSRMSVPNFTIQYPSWGNTACFRKVIATRDVINATHTYMHVTCTGFRIRLCEVKYLFLVPTRTHTSLISHCQSSVTLILRVLYYYHYRSVTGKRPWALKHYSRFWPAWALTWDQNPIRLYRSCYSDPLKCGTWALTREWALARDTTVSTNVSHTSLDVHFI